MEDFLFVRIRNFACPMNCNAFNVSFGKSNGNYAFALK